MCKCIANIILNLLCLCSVTLYGRESCDHYGQAGTYINGLLGNQIRDVPPHFLSVAIGAKIIKGGKLDLLAGSKRFRTLASGLSPAILRYGGTSAMFVLYEEEEEDMTNNEKDISSLKMESSADIVLSTYNEDVVYKEYKNYTMTAHDLGTLLDFAENVGMKLLFDVNNLYRTPDGREWDPTNARLIFKEVKARNKSILWQLGNEPNSYKYKFNLTFTAEQDAADFEVFNQELCTIFHQSIAVGPDITQPKKRNSEVIEMESVAGVKIASQDFLYDYLFNLKMNLSAITWHQYYIDGRIATLDDFLSPSLLDELKYSISQIAHVRDQLAPNTPLWLSETSSAYGGGAKGLSNRYADGFSWLDKLGIAAIMGIDVVTRQTLHGGSYALVDSSIDPLPSYWLSYVYKNLVGGRVLNLTLEGAPSTARLYCHCQKWSSTHSYQPGNFVIYGMNLDSKPVEVSISGIEGNYFIEEYLLEPQDGDLQSNETLLSGKILKMVSDEELPEIPSVILPNQEFTIPATTFGFWIYVNAGIKECLE